MEQFTHIINGYLGELKYEKYNGERADSVFSARWPYWVKPKNFVVIIALASCKNFEEIAEMISKLPVKKGGKRKGIGVAGVKRRAEKGFKELKALFDVMKANLDKKTNES